MKKLFVLLVISMALVAQAWAGVEKKQKSEVRFKGVGKYVRTETVLISGEKERTDYDSDFKGEGFLGGMAGKMFLRPENAGEIINLPESSVIRLDHKKKEYEVVPIEKLKAGEGMSSAETESGEAPEKEGEEPAEESDIRVIRQEFKVDDTGEQKKINGFPSRKYVITWLSEWENVNTKEKGIDSLSTILWTTQPDDEMKTARQEEAEFSKAYLNKMGLDVSGLQQEILGANWMNIFAQLNPGKEKPQVSGSDAAAEMQKIDGYPVVIDGKYFAIRPGQEQAEEAQEEEQTDVSDTKSLFGGFAKKMLKKKEEKKEVEGPEPAFSYYTELLELKTTDVKADKFQVPDNYKKK